jgi:outer membrane protein assembly factor BamA
VPEIATDPNGGTTIGVLPVWLRTDEHQQIDRIIAPDVLYNSYFGWGMHARLYMYPSDDVQWSVVAGIKQRVEREFKLEYQAGRARQGRWSFAGSLVSNRDGTPRFFGIGNDTPQSAETNYTAQQQGARALVGYNISHAWQLAYIVRLRWVDVLPGTLPKINSIEDRFGDALLGNDREFLHRLALIYDTRDNLTISSRGAQAVAYVGAASRELFFNEAMYKEAGFDGRGFWRMSRDTILAAHVALHYLFNDHSPPFWALSTLGGGRSDVGGEQPLRGFGAGRYTDRDAFATTVELRHRLFSFDAMATHADIEVSPFVDVGRVFASSDTFPISSLHTVGGIGFRGIAKPFVVGYVDIGYGSEGTAIFTGINYPF